MKKQIRRLSPHQNGKVFGVLMAISSLVFVLPLFLLTLLAGPDIDPYGSPAGFPKFMFVLFPLIYLVIGYITTAIGCLAYNFLYKFVGGFEFEMRDQDV